MTIWLSNNAHTRAECRAHLIPSSHKSDVFRAVVYWLDWVHCPVDSALAPLPHLSDNPDRHSCHFPRVAFPYGTYCAGFISASNHPTRKFFLDLIHAGTLRFPWLFIALTLCAAKQCLWSCSKPSTIDIFTCNGFIFKQGPKRKKSSKLVIFFQTSQDSWTL